MTALITPGTGRRRLYLMRHGHVDYFAEGLEDFRTVPLTAEGREQAQAAGEALARINIDTVFHSGLPRTIETAGLVMGRNGVSDNADFAEPVPELEEIQGGTYIAETKEELAARLAYSFETAADEGASFLPGGEPFSTAYDRVVRGLNKLVLERDWKTALLVAHEGVNRILLGHVTGAGLEGMRHFEQDLACINILDFDVTPLGDAIQIERIIIKGVNITPYDYVKAGLPKTSLEHMFDIEFPANRSSAYSFSE